MVTLRNRCLFGSVAAAVLVLGVASAPARAEITGLTVRSAKDIGPFRGKPYREIEAQLQGTAPGGAYSVPVTIAYPARAPDHNGFAIVDIINTVTIGDEKWVLGGRPYPVARLQLGDDFTFGMGNAYVAPLWDKKAVEALHNGSVAARADGYTILRDAATLARNPARYLQGEAVKPPASGKIVAHGYSTSGALLRTWYFDHLNNQGGALAFDGGVVAGADGTCYDLKTDDYRDCAGPLADGGKVIALMTETDAQAGGSAERGDNPNYRTIEIAGVPHLPASWVDFRGHGMPEQNPIGFFPVVRATFANLEMWIEDGKEPPPSVAIALTDAPATKLECCGPVREAVRDADGNAKGGVRLPHMTSVLPDGGKAGAPLGTYTGIDWKYGKDNAYFTIGGTFTPFPPEKIKSLYPTHAAYVDAVTASANDLVTKRYILPEDATAYIEEAKRSNIGQP